MVFGNMGDDSGTGVAFTRDPATGENVFYGEFLMNAQGEDVVAGTRTPLLRSRRELGGATDAEERAARPHSRSACRVLQQLAPRTLERHYRDMHGHRVHHRAAARSTCCSAASGSARRIAAIRIAVDMVKERLIDREDRRCCASSPSSSNQLLRPVFDAAAKTRPSGGRCSRKGLNAGPGRGQRA